MLRLVADPLYLWFSGSVPKTILDKILSYRPDGYFFSPQYKKGFWNGYVSFLKKYPRKDIYYCAVGFLNRICSALDEADWAYELVDQRESESVEPVYNLLPNIELYDYQRTAVDIFLTHGRGILKLATGAGKTELGAAVIKSINQKTVWFTHRHRLLYQTRDRLRDRLGEEIGIVGDQVYEPQNITVAMVQSAATEKFRDFIKDCKLVVGDEIHHAVSEQFYDNLASVPAPWRLGLTATPYLSGPGLGLVGMCGEILMDIKAIDLILRGRLICPDLWFVKYQSKHKLAKKTDWRTVYREGIVNNIQRNEAIKDVASVFQRDQKSCITLVKRVGHGDTLCSLLNYFKVRTEFIKGSTSHEEREKVLRQLWEGKISNVIATAELVSEGADFPQLRALINATGMSGGGNRTEDAEAGGTTIQILGRGLRKHPGKTSFDYVDFVDDAHKDLMRATSDRLGTLISEGYEPLIKYWHEYPMLI